MINTTAFSTYNFQRVWAVFSYVFQVFFREASDVLDVVVLAAWGVENHVTIHCDGWLKFAEET